MKIECLIHRPGPVFTPVDIDGVNYQFRPAATDASGPHVAEVTIQAHINRFLSITEAYRSAEPEDLDEEDPILIEPAAPAQVLPPATAILAMPPGLNMAAAARAAVAVEPVAVTVTPTPPTGPAQPEDHDDEGDDDQAQPTGSVFEKLSLPELREAYEKAFGKRPAANLGRAKMVLALETLPPEAQPQKE